MIENPAERVLRRIFYAAKKSTIIGMLCLLY